MANNYCAVPHEYLDECEMLTDEEFGRLMRLLLRYSRDGEVVELTGNERYFARRVMHQEDINALHYAAVTEKRREAGRKGAASKWHLPDLPDGKMAGQNR